MPSEGHSGVLFFDISEETITRTFECFRSIDHAARKAPTVGQRRQVEPPQSAHPAGEPTLRAWCPAKHTRRKKNRVQSGSPRVKKGGNALVRPPPPPYSLVTPPVSGVPASQMEPPHTYTLFLGDSATKIQRWTCFAYYGCL